MLDPIVSLAISLQASPGVYALLIGSGVSRSAGILTGWEILRDLISKLAILHKEDCESDPLTWYQTKFNREPNYSDLLKEIAYTRTERQQLLRSYFEPSDEEREDGLKTPTKAHTSIAKLVAEGFCKLVITTNFDRLVEDALAAEGIAPTVISSSDTIQGALPLTHQKCCVVKVNGDYLDARVRNTQEELQDYDDEMSHLLDRIFDEFGLVICGWSAEWDTGLRSALERSKSRRFTQYWTTRARLNKYSQKLVESHSGQVIKIQDADQFFEQLAELAFAVHDSNRPHPESLQALVALEKRFLSEPRFRIQLEELVTREVEKTYEQLVHYNEELLSTREYRDDVENCTRKYREICETSLHLLMNGAVFGKDEHIPTWIAAIVRLVIESPSEGRVYLVEEIRHYPSVHLFYSIGLSSIARENYRLLASLFLKPRHHRYDSTLPLVQAIKWNGVSSFIENIEEHERDYTPLSERLYSDLRDPFRTFVPSDSNYDEVFDRFEFLLAAYHVHLELKQEGKPRLFPIGRFGWKAHRRDDRPYIGDVLEAEAQELGQSWPIINVGLFNGEIAKFERAKKMIDEYLARLSW